MTSNNAEGPLSASRTFFRWITFIGLWWSFVALAYSMRTPKMALEQLAQWIDIVEWALSPLYYVWSLVRDAFIYVTAPIYGLLSFDLSQEVRDALSFGFFLGLRVLPLAIKFWVSTEDKRPDWLHFLGMIGGMLFVIMGLPYLLACDHAGSWLSLHDPQAWVFGLTFEIALAAGILLWLLVDPFEFVSRMPKRRESPEP